MGASPSNARQREFVTEIERWPEFQERTCLTSSDISGIAAAFRKAIEHGEGDSLQRTDFEHWLEMAHKPKPVEERLFEVFLVSGSDERISLYDFVVGLLNYCVDGKEHLSRLAFDVYDRHTTGTITEADLEGMLIDVWGPNWEGEELARRLLTERSGTDPMPPGEWEEFCRVYPNLLHPIYKLQRTLQDFTLGKKRWAKLYERLKKRKARMEADHARTLRDALTQEDKLKAMQDIREEKAGFNVLNGTKSQRMVAAREAADGTGNGGGLLPGIAVMAGQGGVHRGGPSMTTLTKSMEVRDRLDAIKKRSAAMEADPTNWDENPLNRKNSKPIAEEGMPTFSMIPKKVKAGDLGEGGQDGDGYKTSSAVTPGSNGATRSPLGSPSNGTQRKRSPSLADTERSVGGAGGDHRGSVGDSARIGGGHAYAGSTLGSSASGGRSRQASDARSDSKVGRPTSGELAKKRSSMAAITRKQSLAINNTMTHRKTSVAMAALTHRPDITAKSGRKPSVAVGGGGGSSKRSSVAAFRDNKRDLLSTHRKVSQQGAGARRTPSRAVAVAGP
eukprot:g9195.t1